MSAVYALYSNPDAAQRAVNGLYAAGIPEGDVVVMSGEPFEEQPFAHRDSATWLWYIACLGGFVGLVFSTWLTRMTELAWPLQTGNMPIVAWWPNLIVISNMMIRFGHHATIGMFPVRSGHASSVMRVSQVENARPTMPPANAIHPIHVALSRCANSCSSNGSADRMVMRASAIPAARRPSTARCAAAGFG